MFAHEDTTRMCDEDSSRAKKRAAWAGAAVNGPMAAVKIAVGIWSNSQALVADGVHSLSDLASDAAVLWALGHAHKPPDAEHPFGHGRFETLATLAIAAMLGLAALGILLDAAMRVAQSAESTPDLPALVVAAASILLKEGLYHYTRAVALRTGSAMMLANAWHHRSDAASSVVALVGIGAAMAGLPAMDAVAAAIIAAMLARIAWRFGRPAIAELVDSAPEDGLDAPVIAALADTPGVRDVHDLRLRRTGDALQADVHLGLDPDLTLSEAHRLCEAARARVKAAVPQVHEIVIHPEPHGHADGFGAHRAALRPAVRKTIETCLQGLVPPASIAALHLDYRNAGIRAAVVVEGAGGADAQVEEAVRDRLATLLAEGATDVVALRIYWTAPMREEGAASD